MQLEKIFEDEYKYLKLRKVHLKNKNTGYILKEMDDGMLKVFVVGATQPAIISPQDVDIEQSLSNLDKLKMVIAMVLKDKMTAMAIKDMDNTSDIDATLLGNGCSFEDLYKIYKKAYLQDSEACPICGADCTCGCMNESLLSKVGNTWNKLSSGIKKAKDFSKGDYGAFSSSKTPQKSDTQQLYHKPVYNMTMFKLNQPFPINSRDFVIKKGSGNKIMFTIKSPLVGTIEGYSPEIIKMFDGGKYLAGNLVIKTISGQPLKLLRGHYLVEPRTIK